ncbi:MAG: N-acetylmuramoyl-L-alanine amidase [Methylophagaceae bacterium]|jgi:N-acetylmuramoyl-L-alanine amidase
MHRLFLSLLLLLLSVTSAWATSIDAIRLSQTGEKTRLVFDLTDEIAYSSFKLDNPDRIVIDLTNTAQSTIIKLPNFDGTPIKNIRYAQRKNNTFRIVIDLLSSREYIAQKLPPNGANSHRLVIDLSTNIFPFPQNPTTKIAPSREKPDVILATKPEPEKKVDKPKTTIVKTIKPRPRRDIVIAIDAGHGGKDPGAIGKSGTKEKDIVLAIARKLANLVDEEQGMRAYLTRDNDTFISLRGRINRARQQKADMFISIHADAFHRPEAKGASVYVLSKHGASSEAAQMLADKENAADLIGGIRIGDKDDDLASVLLDLSQTASLVASTEVAEKVLTGLKRVGNTHKKQVESAAFVVLKSPDIPSILVETAFISNPSEERKLRNSSHQNKLALAMLSGIRNYFQRNPPLGTHTTQRHIVSRGDTLSTIAQRYQVKLAQLKSNNGLTHSHLKIGDVLFIP